MPTNNTAQAASGETYEILLGSADWNEEWKRLQNLRRKKDDPKYWNTRAKNFDNPDNQSPYVQELLERAAIKPGTVVLDMGCGTGSLAVPLAKAGSTVFAADFNESMLAEAKRRATTAGVDSIDYLHMSWEDNWDAFGIKDKSVDVVMASRSLSVSDLGAALDKMCRTARKRCMATMSCGCSPRMDSRVLEACGLKNTHGRDYQYAWNILTNAGYEVDVSFIYSTRKDTFADAQSAYADFKRMIDDVSHLYPASEIDNAYARLHEWLAGELVNNEEAGQLDEKGYPQGALRLRQARIIPWAYLEWNVE